MGGYDDHYCNEATLSFSFFEGDHTHSTDAHTHTRFVAGG